MNELTSQKTQFSGTGSTNNRIIEKQNIRTLMQTLHGCRKNCRECKEDEEEIYGEAKIIHQEAKHA